MSLAQAPVAAQPESDIAPHRHMREQRTFLGHIANTTFFTGHKAVAGIIDHLSSESHFPGIGPLEPGNDPQQGGLAAARRTQDGRERLLSHGQIDAAQDQLSTK